MTAARAGPLVLALALSLSSCADTAAPKGRLTVMLSNVPADDVLSASVDVREIVLRSADDGREQRFPGPSRPLPLRTCPTEPLTLVAAARLPAGEYSEMRLVIAGASAKVVDEPGASRFLATQGARRTWGRRATGTLSTPGWNWRGVEVSLPGQQPLEIEPREHITLVARFDVPESIRRDPPGSGDWVLRPVVSSLPLAATAAIDLEVKPTTHPARRLLAGARAVLLDSAGNRERGCALDSRSGPSFHASFQLLDPAEGPFSSAIVDASGVELARSEVVDVRPGDRKAAAVAVR